jgi:hypothetical protein
MIDDIYMTDHDSAATITVEFKIVEYLFLGYVDDEFVF